ncbi:carbohydrate ABC transporter permease [Pseudoflavonifractor capillosus]|uniref:carbohydrate ABC transporter permease n=1 Tax=Pseudoflavonifractor capillosus TaxID=106588 RepID=UPI0019592E20|nr:carbohydrate ABC transporter permease [Pseudoflavonifractor capillosus]MBM6897792.1 carbohydrate ABC transporter permease [Pseudoflavonifractor capillosus]HIT25042.1 carbohydrate ABC transporter permease [Candidatus Enterenecus avicola]
MNRTTRIGGKSAATVITYACLIIGSVIMIFPFVWMILTALKSMSESVRIPPTFFPEVPYFENFQYALTSLPFGKLYINTALMVLGRVVCAIVFSSMAGYAFAKLHFKGKNVLFALVLIQMMMPSQIFVIPQYEMLSKVGMTESIFALIFPGLVSAFGTFFLRQAYMGIPDEIAEAAYLDGCNQWQAFYKVLFPLTGSAIAALTIFTAVFAYADLMWPLVVNTDINLMTLSSGLATLKGQFTTNYPVLMAGSLFAMVPMLVLYLIFQRKFIEGIALTGGK